MDSLAKCPFCGGEAEIRGEILLFVRCAKCGTRLGEGYYATKAEAARAWNTRAERTCMVAASYSPSDMNDEQTWYFAFSCGHELYWDEPKPPSYCPECGAKVARNG